MVWTYHDPERERAITDEIDRQEDRGAAIIAAAFLEDRIALAIKERMLSDAAITNPLFKGTGPLSSFSVKTDFACLLGLITKSQRRTIQTIIKIRNDFAHKMEPLTFGSQHINDLCGNLYKQEDIAPVRVLVELMATQSGRLDILLYVDQWFSKIEGAKARPRDIYIATIQILMFQFMLLKRDSHFVASVLAAALRNRSDVQPPPATQTGNRTRQRRTRPRRSSQA